MTFAAQTAEGAARALVIAGLALALAVPLSRLLAHTHGAKRTLVWTLLLAPLLTPALLVSYAWSHLALRLMTVPLATSALYLTALTLKLVPVAAVILHFLPPALSPEALHTHALLHGETIFGSTKNTKGHEKYSPFRVLSCLSWTASFRLRGAGRGPWIAGGLVFLLAFTDFELASLWSLKTWPVALFDAQVGGLALGASLRLAALPLAVEFTILALLFLSRGTPVARSSSGKPPRPSARRALLVYLAIAALLACGWPLGRVLAGAATGFRSVAENFVLLENLGASLAFAGGAVLCVWPLAAWLAPNRRASLFFALPGLLGALLLALLLLTAFQVPALHPAYDTPLPLLLALTLLLLPLAIPLRLLLDANRRNPALHLARMSASPALIWRLDTSRHWLAAGLLFCWAYFDFTAGSILAPIGLTPVFVRLHNLAHYGQTAVLSAMFLAAFAAPVAVLLFTAPLARWYARRDGR